MHTHLCSHTFLHPVYCAALTEETVSHFSVILRFAFCWVSVNLGSVATKKRPVGDQNNHLLLSKEAFLSETMTPTRAHTRPRAPAYTPHMFSTVTKRGMKLQTPNGCLSSYRLVSFCVLMLNRKQDKARKNTFK